MTVTCELCGKQYKSKRHLRLHFGRNHVDKSEWTDECEICGKVYADSEILKRHQLTHDSQNWIHCEEDGCAKSFTTASSYHKHKQTMHKGLRPHPKLKKPYDCHVEGCEASFTKHHLVTQHSYVHTRIPPFSCAICDRSFLTQAHRNRHMKVHNGYQCTQCDKSLTTWSDLRSHIAIHHPKEFKCSVCDKVFHMACRLKEHKAVHSEERQVYKCRKCDKTFVRKSNLKSHVKVVHLNQHNFKCPHQTCERSFAYKHSLMKHMKVHQDGYIPPKKRTPKGRKKISLISRITGMDPKQQLIPVIS